MKHAIAWSIAFLAAGTAAADAEVFGENEIAEDVHAIEADQAEPIDHMDEEPGRPEFGESAILLKQPPPLGASRESTDAEPADGADETPRAPEPDTYIIVEEAGTVMRMNKNPDAIAEDSHPSDEAPAREIVPLEEEATEQEASATETDEESAP